VHLHHQTCKPFEFSTRILSRTVPVSSVARLGEEGGEGGETACCRERGFQVMGGGALLTGASHRATTGPDCPKLSLSCPRLALLPSCPRLALPLSCPTLPSGASRLCCCCGAAAMQCAEPEVARTAAEAEEVRSKAEMRERTETEGEASALQAP